MSKSLIDDQLPFFKQVSLFKNLNEKQIKKILNIMTLSDVKKGEMITREGDLGDSMFILLQGEVEMSGGGHTKIRDFSLHP